MRGWLHWLEERGQLWKKEGESQRGEEREGRGATVLVEKGQNQNVREVMSLVKQTRFQPCSEPLECSSLESREGKGGQQRLEGS